MAVPSPRSERRQADPAELLDAARRGDRGALAKLVSAIEQGGSRARATAALAYRVAADATTIGITGAPGAGKSTLTGRLVGVARAAGVAPVGVLAIDPTSPFSGGAILGDRVRMQEHALDRDVFIRSMATRGHLGGLALAVPEAVRVLAAVGLPLVLIETVGVGQVEVEVAGATDTTVVVVNPGWGDAVQANKAGLLEVADVFVINKADRPGARETRRDLEQMLDLTASDGWRPPVVETVASSGAGVEDLWAAIEDHRAHLAGTGLLDERRHRRLERELQAVLRARLASEVDRVCRGARYDELVALVVEHRVDPYAAADRLLALLRASLPEAGIAADGDSGGGPAPG